MKTTSEKLIISDAIAKCNKLILLTAILLLSFGLIAVFSADYSQSLFVKQIIFVSFGSVICAIFTLLNYKVLASKKMLITFLILFIIMLTVLAFCAITGQNLDFGIFKIRKINSAYRWFDFGKFNFQPSVFVKVVLILFVALKLSQTTNSEKKITKTHKKYKKKSVNLLKKVWEIFIDFLKKNKEILIFSAIIIICIKFQPSNTIIFSILVILFAMFALKDTKFAWSAVFLILFFVLAWHTSPYFSKRFGGNNFQSEQAVLAISTGGWAGYENKGLPGSGLGQGEHKYPGRLPEVENDFIFSIIAQETGFLISLAFLLTYAVFITAGFLTALNTQDEFGKFTAFGITTSYAFSFLMHFAVNLGFVNTGSSLPFVSYGGTAMIADMIMLGILLNISAGNYVNKKYERIR